MLSTNKKGFTLIELLIVVVIIVGMVRTVLVKRVRSDAAVAGAGAVAVAGRSAPRRNEPDESRQSEGTEECCRRGEPVLLLLRRRRRRSWWRHDPIARRSGWSSLMMLCYAMLHRRCVSVSPAKQGAVRGVTT